MDGPEVGAVRIEQGQCRVPVGATRGVPGVIPADTRTHFVTEPAELGLTGDECAKIAWMRHDSVRIRGRYAQDFVEDPLIS